MRLMLQINLVLEIMAHRNGWVLVECGNIQVKVRLLQHTHKKRLSVLSGTQTVVSSLK